MGFSYVKMRPDRRLFLIYYATGRSVEEVLAEMPGANGEPGLKRSTYDYWVASDKMFVDAMRSIEEDPDWCHDNIVVPVLLAEDDLAMIRRARGDLKDDDGSKIGFRGYSVKQRELILNERRKLNRDESTADKFLSYMIKLEQKREARELQQQKQQALPAPIIEVLPSDAEGEA